MSCKIIGIYLCISVVQQKAGITADYCLIQMFTFFLLFNEIIWEQKKLLGLHDFACFAGYWVKRCFTFLMMKRRTVKQRKSGYYQIPETISEYAKGAWTTYSTFLNLCQFHKSKVKLEIITLDIFNIGQIWEFISDCITTSSGKNPTMEQDVSADSKS